MLAHKALKEASLQREQMQSKIKVFESSQPEQTEMPLELRRRALRPATMRPP